MASSTNIRTTLVETNFGRWILWRVTASLKGSGSKIGTVKGFGFPARQKTSSFLQSVPKKGDGTVFLLGWPGCYCPKLGLFLPWRPSEDCLF